MRKTTRANPPNPSDPMAEPTIGRRMIAAGVRRFGSKLQFANAIGKSFQSVDAWELGKSAPDLENVVKTSDVTGFSVELLIRGIDGSNERARGVLDSLDATAAERAAFDAHAKGDGRFDSLTPEYVVAWIKRGRELDAACEEVRARERAVAAREAQVDADARRSGARKVAAPKRESAAQARRRRPTKSDRAPRG